jgi:uncharacterized protein
MKIICLEEHTASSGIAKATQLAKAAEAGYMAEWGSRVIDKAAAFTGNRPHLVPAKTALELAPDVGAARIAEMDKCGIDMQVLSYSNAAQLAPVGQAVELTREANDKLAEAVRTYPIQFAGFAASRNCD